MPAPAPVAVGHRGVPSSPHQHLLRPSAAEATANEACAGTPTPPAPTRLAVRGAGRGACIGTGKRDRGMPRCTSQRGRGTRGRRPHSRSPRRPMGEEGVDEATAAVCGGRPRPGPENAGAAPTLPQRPALAGAAPTLPQRPAPAAAAPTPGAAVGAGAWRSARQRPSHANAARSAADRARTPRGSRKRNEGPAGPPVCAWRAIYFKCELMSLVISNIETCALPSTSLSLASALIIVFLALSCRAFFLM